MAIASVTQQQVTISSQQEEVVLGLCGVCPEGCVNLIHMVDGKIERLQPIKGDPDSIVCPRGMSAKEVVYSPDRILYPQMRIGERGEGRFKRISWDEAYDFIVEKIKSLSDRYGPQSLAVYTGRGNFEFGLNEMFSPSDTIESSANSVLFPFGSPNTTGVGALCYVSYGMIAPRACFGAYLRDIYEDLDNSDLILVWGDNPITDSPPKNFYKLKKAIKKGAKVIVIDHRRSETARALRTEWIGLRPGTDCALALGAIHVLIEEDLYDHEFVEKWTHGFGELREYVKQFTPEVVEQITWVPAETIRSLALQVGHSKACSIITYTGLEYSNCGVQSLRAVWTLQALVGSIDIPGGKVFKMPSRIQTNRLLTSKPEGTVKPIGYKEFPLYYEVRNEAHASLFPRAILENNPYPLRGMIIAGSSVITAWPEPSLWRRALAALDMLVVINRFPTEDSLYADLILPATTMFEIESYMVHDNRVILRQRVIPPRGEARNDYLIFAELANRLGYGNLYPQTEREMVEFALKHTGITVNDLLENPGGVYLPEPKKEYKKYETGGLRNDGIIGFNTPTGKFEIASEWLKAHGYDPLPAYIEPKEGPISSPYLAKKYPLVFNSGARTNYDFRSQHHNIPSLLSRHPFPLVHMNKKDASSRGIREGDIVKVINSRGEVLFRAHIDTNIKAGVVEVNMGGGGPLGSPEWRQSNVNMLTDRNNFDEISGFPVYKALLCDVVKI
jgi:anaerobic selenocysteine-containing dehydrogenase